jgi:protein-L-isoaspartate(D-aspartate) O-methyltransferase
MSKDYPDPEEVRLQARDGLIAELRHEGIRDGRVLEAISKVPREEFVLEGDRHRAYENRALAIERGQTISQPLIVAMMTELLELKGEEKVLEIGTGSGYQAAVLSLLAKDVFSIEIDPVLATQARERLHRLGYRNVHVRQGDGFYGWPEEAPFDGIIVTAVAPRIPEPLVDQLRVGGALVLPLEEGWNETLVRARKREDGSLQIERFGSVAFVPMRGAIRAPKEQQR